MWKMRCWSIVKIYWLSINGVWYKKSKEHIHFRHFIFNVDRTQNISMMTSSNGNIFRVIGHLCGNSPVPGYFPTQRPVMRSFDVFFDLRLNKRLSKQSWGWWFETPASLLWRHWNALLIVHPKYLNLTLNSQKTPHITHNWEIARTRT